MAVAFPLVPLARKGSESQETPKAWELVPARSQVLKTESRKGDPRLRGPTVMSGMQLAEVKRAQVRGERAQQTGLPGGTWSKTATVRSTEFLGEFVGARAVLRVGVREPSTRFRLRR